MTRPRVVASIEARMTSSRLPGKVLEPIEGVPALGRLVARLRRAETLDGIVLATTDRPTDDGLADWAVAQGIAVHRGSENDVLERVVEAHAQMRSDIVVEVTGDCPLLDPDVIDLGVRTYFANGCDVVSNTWQLSFPMGVDVQVFPFPALEEVARTVHDPAVREHVSLHFYERPDHYRIFHLQAPRTYRGPERRFQLDYPEDLDFIRAVYRRLGPGDLFGTPEILRLLETEPELARINARCIEKEAR